MDPEQLKKALDAIEAGDSAAALEILKAMIASAASGGAPPASETAAAGGEAPAPDPEKDPLEAASIAASAELVRITGAANPGEMVTRVAAMFATVQSLEAGRAALELTERQGLIRELVLAGAETPATAWAGDDKSKCVPVKRLADEPIAELRERVKLVTAAAGARRAGHRPPAGGSDGGGQTISTSRGEVVLSAREIANCKAQGADVNAYAENKAIRASARIK